MQTKFSLFLTVCLILISCERRTLWDELDDRTKTNIEVDWSNSRWADFDEGEKPTGMTILAYEKSGKTNTISTITNNLSNAQILLPQGEWQILVFSQSIPEYASLKFSGMGKFETAKIETVPQQSRWFSATRSKNADNITKQPIWFASDQMEGLIVEEGTVASGFIPHTRYSDGTFFPLSAIQKCDVKIHFKGMQNLASARAIISGVAKEWNISKGCTNNEKTAHELTGWQKTPSETDQTLGYIETTFQTFGMPNGFTHTAEELYLHIDILLRDGETIKSYNLAVGDKIKTTISNEIDLELCIAEEEPIILPNVEPSNSSNGFLISVDDWGEEIVIDLNL